MRIRSGSLLRRWLAVPVALAVLLPSSLHVAHAQNTGIDGSKRLIFAVAGAAVAAVPTFLVASEETLSFQSTCTSRGCATAVAGFMGGLVGFLIGREVDARNTRRMAAGPSLSYEYRNFPLDVVPDHLASFPGGTAVAGISGAQVVLSDGTIWSRGLGVRGIEDLAILPRLELLIMSTAANLLAFPVRGDSAPGRVIDERGGGQVAATNDLLAVAGLDVLRLLRFHSTGDDVSVESHEGAEGLGFVSDIAIHEDGEYGWALVDDRIVTYDANLNSVGEVELPAVGRTIRARGDRLAVAAGSNGVFVLDASDPEAPELVEEFTGVRFAYAADLGPELVYVAAGWEGVVVLDISRSEPQVVGVAREVRFANDVALGDGGSVWILDREGRQVQIAQFASPAEEGLSGGDLNY